MGKITFIDSTGIGTLANLIKTMKAKGGDLHLVSIPSPAEENFSAFPAVRGIPSYDTLEEADGKIGS